MNDKTTVDSQKGDNKMRKSKTAGSAKLVCALLVLGTTGITAYAANTAPPDPVAESAPAQPQADLAAQAKLSEAEAISAAQIANPGYTFTVKELEDEHGTVLYELKGADANGASVKCYINAMDGSVETRECEQEDDSEDAAKQAELAAQATITEAEAISAAQAAVPGWDFSKSELDSENGTIVYELKGTDANGKKQKILVNAMDGSMIQETDEED